MISSSGPSSLSQADSIQQNRGEEIAAIQRIIEQRTARQEPEEQSRIQHQERAAMATDQPEMDFLGTEDYIAWRLPHVLTFS
jgi:hypothetical protein